MAQQASATVQMDENGRITIPKSTRRALCIDGETADLDLDVAVLNREAKQLDE